MRGGVPDPQKVPNLVRDALEPLRRSVPADVPDDLLVRGLKAWTELIGTISLEINGQFENVVSDRSEYFDHVMRRTAVVLGLG